MPQKLRTWDAIKARRAYIDGAMRGAQYRAIALGGWHAQIPGFDGLWAAGQSPAEARKVLRSTLIGWLRVHVEQGGNPLPLLPPPRTRKTT